MKQNLTYDHHDKAQKEMCIELVQSQIMTFFTTMLNGSGNVLIWVV